MKCPPILLFLLFANFLFGQDKKISKRTFGIEIQPKVSVPVLEDKGIAEASNKAGAGISGIVFFNFHPQLSFKTGLGINLIRISQKDYSPQFACDFDGNTVDLFQSWQTHDFSIYYFSIPAHLKWDFTDRKNHLYVRLGADILFRIGSRGQQVIHECGSNELESNTSIRNFSPFLIFTGLGIGYEFTLKNKRQFYIEPNVSYSLKPLFDTRTGGILSELKIPYNSNLINLGLTAGLKF